MAKRRGGGPRRLVQPAPGQRAEQPALGGEGWRSHVSSWQELRADLERVERRLVGGAREAGETWDSIAATLGGAVSRETLRRRYGP